MTGIEKITARIAADADAEVRALKAESDGKCAAIRASNERAAQAAFDRIVRDGAKDSEQRASRMDRTARLEAKKSVLAMKQQAVSDAFSLAKKKIAALPEADYVGFLARQAAAAAITGQEELIFSEDDRRRVGAKVARSANELLAKRGADALLSVSEETRAMAGGVIVKQGDIEVNCTLDTLLDLYRGELAAQVAEVLFAN